jgi:hypothetical protein
MEERSVAVDISGTPAAGKHGEDLMRFGDELARLIVY